jgi:hypothetical protein
MSIVPDQEYAIDLETRSSGLYFFFDGNFAIKKVFMKTATPRLYRTVSLMIALVILLGSSTAVFAGEGKRVVRGRYAGQTLQTVIQDTGAGTTPRPVVDETPIDPEHFKNNPASQQADTGRPPVKRAPDRRR